MAELEELSALVVDTGYRMHRDLGPGLFESVYEQILAAKLEKLGLGVERQTQIDIVFEDIHIERAFKLDLLIEKKLLVEIKSERDLAPVHAKQVITYLRLLRLPLGLLINFGGETYKQGVRRIVNNHTDFASSRLRAHQK